MKNLYNLFEVSNFIINKLYYTKMFYSINYNNLGFLRELLKKKTSLLMLKMQLSPKI